jgi:hypothetical protein
MKTTFDHARQLMARAGKPLRRWPLFHRSLGLLVTLFAYGAGALTVSSLTGEAIMPVILFLVFFLPAVLRAWLLVYWQVRVDIRALRRSRQRGAGAH